MADKSNIRRGSEGGRGVYHTQPLYCMLSEYNTRFSHRLSHQEATDGPREFKRRWKCAQGEISLLVILHAADTEAITNTQRPNYIFWKEEEKDKIVTLG